MPGSTGFTVHNIASWYKEGSCQHQGQNWLLGSNIIDEKKTFLISINYLDLNNFIFNSPIKILKKNNIIIET